MLMGLTSAVEGSRTGAATSLVHDKVLDSSIKSMTRLISLFNTRG